MAQIIKGDDLMLFDAQGKSIAFATSHSLSINADAADVSSKDSGVWKANEVNKLGWEITSENLYTSDAYDTLFTSMVSRTSIDVHFGIKKETTQGTETNWTKGAGTYTGKAFITSLTANANSGDNATFSITLTGTGEIKKATA